MTTFSERKQQISMSILCKLDLIYLRSKRCPKIHMDYGHTCSHTSLAQLLGFQLWALSIMIKIKLFLNVSSFLLGFIHPPLVPIELFVCLR